MRISGPEPILREKREGEENTSDFDDNDSNPRNVGGHGSRNSDEEPNNSSDLKVAVNTIVPRSPFFLFLYLKTQTVTHIRKNAVEYLRQWNGAICVIYNLCQRQNIR